MRPVRVGYYTASRNHVDVNLVKKLESSEDGTVSSGCAQVCVCGLCGFVGGKGEVGCVFVLLLCAGSARPTPSSFPVCTYADNTINPTNTIDKTNPKSNTHPPPKTKHLTTPPTPPTPSTKHPPKHPQKVVAKVWGYRKVWLQSHRVFETGTFSLPPLEYDTRGFFVDLPLDVQREVCGYVCGLCVLEDWGTVIWGLHLSFSRKATPRFKNTHTHTLPSPPPTAYCSSAAPTRGPVSRSPV